jgi:hypothetical protein
MSDTEHTHFHGFVWLQFYATSHENQKLFCGFGSANTNTSVSITLGFSENTGEMED